jgi:GAF domain-containing protein
MNRIERILEISRELVSADSLDTLLRRIVDAAVELTSSDMAAILLLDERTGRLQLASASVEGDSPLDLTVPREGYAAGQVLSSGEPMLLEKVKTTARKKKPVGPIIGFEPHSLLAVPLKSNGRSIGVLEVENGRSEARFDERDVETLMTLASQAAVAVDKALLVRSLLESRDLAEALREAGAVLSGTLDSDEVIVRILEQIFRVMPEAAANIMLLEGETARVFRGRGYEQFGAEASVTSISLDVADVPAFREMQRTGEPLVIPDVDRYEGWVHSRPEHGGFKSYVGVPMAVRGAVIGYLNVNSSITGHFSESDGRLLRTFADHAANAIGNAQLYDQVQMELAERERVERALSRHRDQLEEMVQERTFELTAANELLQREISDRMETQDMLQRRNRELMALNSVTQALSTSLELRAIVEDSLTRMVEALGFAGGVVALAEEPTRDLALFCQTGLYEPISDTLTADCASSPLCEYVYANRETLFLEDLNKDAPADAKMLVEAGAVTYAAAPIVHQERSLGMFFLVDNIRRTRSGSTIALLTAIGQQIGVAVENTRLFRDVVRERQASNTLLDTAKALSTTLRIDRLLENVLDELQRVVPYDSASIHMVRENRCWAIASRGPEPATGRVFTLDERPLIKRVVEQGQPVIVPDVSEEPDWVPGTDAEAIRAWLGVPMVTMDEVIGIMMMDSHHLYAYDAEVARLAFAFAHQVSMAVENSRLYEHVQARLHEATLLHSVTMALSSSLDLETILPYVARSLCEILNGTSVVICSLADDESELSGPTGATAIAKYVSLEGTAREHSLKEGQTFELAELPLSVKALEERSPQQVRLDDPEVDESQKALLMEREAQALLVLPMVAGDVNLGFVQVWETQVPRHFTGGEIATGQTLIHQAATAVYNAQLVDALRQYAAELEAQNAELDAFAHTVAHDLKTPLTSLIGFSSLLNMRLDETADERLRSTLEIIGQNGRKMRNIIDELLLLASVRKMEEVEVSSLDMDGIVGEAMVRLMDVITENQADIMFPEVWPATIGYGPWVEEVWTNYLSNAIKYGGKPPLVELGAEEQADGMVRFWIRDNGDGLSSEDSKQLFTPFTRLHQVEIKGHGLGLSIVQRIVEKLGGQVGVESTGKAGEGSTFFFTLPAGE